MITRLKIDGMRSQHCVQAVFTALTPVPGLIRTEIGIGWATIEHDGSATQALLTEAVAISGKTVVSAIEDRRHLALLPEENLPNG